MMNEVHKGEISARTEANEAPEQGKEAVLQGK